MRSLFALIFILFIPSLFAVNHIDRFQYWFNQDYDQAVSDEFASPAESVIFSENITTGHLSNGLHTFHIRFQDTENMWSSTLSSFFYKIGETDLSGNEIVAYEYWFNNQYEESVEIATQSASTIQLNENLDVEHLSNGLHTFHIRFRDSHGLWSSTFSSFLYKRPVEELADPQIQKVQYWLNNDTQQAVTTEAGNQQIFTLDDSLDFSEITNGIHTFHIRFKDQSGNWSSTLSSFFYKTEAGMATENTIVAYQYWFNQDYPQAITAEANHQQAFILEAMIEPSELPEGIHTFHIRFRDEAGLWSTVQSAFFVKLPVVEIVDNKINKYRYWFDDSVEEVVEVEPEQPVNPLNLITMLSLQHIPQGDYTIHFQFKDQQGYWSSVLSESFTKELLPYAQFTADEQELCPGEVVQFSNFSVDADSWHWDFGDGQESTEFEPQHVYEQQGDFEVTLTASHSETTQQHSVSTLISVFQDYLFEEEHHICGGDTFTWQGNEYTTPGTYTAEYITQNGCDSVYVLNLQVNPVYGFEESHAICHGEVFEWHGNEYFMAGTYEAVYETIHGCDSLYVLHLEVNPSHVFEDTHAICQGDVFEWHGQELNEPGTYEALYETIHGCDSLYVLHLEVNPVYEVEDHHEICAGDTYEWFGQQLSEADTYYHLKQTQAGCDSLLILHLSVFEVDISVTQENQTLMALAQDAYFQWIDCEDDSEIQGATEAIFTPEKTGEYAVWVTQNHCTALSDCYEVIVTSTIQADMESGITIYPNPASSRVHIVMKDSHSDYSIGLYSLNGQKILEHMQLNDQEYVLKLPELPAGVYILHVKQDSQMARFKLIISQ